MELKEPKYSWADFLVDLTLFLAATVIFTLLLCWVMPAQQQIAPFKTTRGNIAQLNAVDVDVCQYSSAATLDAKINEADSAYLGKKANLNVSGNCGSYAINSRVLLHAQHFLNLPQNVVITMTNAAIYLNGQGGGITGFPTTTVNMLPGSCTGLTGINIPNYEVPTLAAVNSGNLYIGGFTMNANADLFVAAGCTTQKDRPISLSDDSVSAPAPHDVTVENMIVLNCGSDCFMGDGSNGSAHSVNVRYLNNQFFGTYRHAIRYQPGNDRALAQGNYVEGYAKKYSVPITSVTSSGTTATVTMSAPLPDIIDTSNSPVLYVTGCADSHYNFPYTVQQFPFLSSITVGGSTFSYTIPAGAAASTTGCTMFLQNNQAPYRADADSSGNIGMVWERNRMLNTQQAREFGLEVFAGAPNNFSRFYGLKVINNIFDANGIDGGTGLSLTAQNVTLMGNQLLHGGSGRFSNGCECSMFGGTITGENYEGGTLAVNNGSGNSVSNITVTGDFQGGYGVEINTERSSFSNITVTLDSSSQNSAGIAVGLSGGAFHSAYNHISNIVVNNLAPGNGTPNSCIYLDGDSSSTSIDIANVQCVSTDFGVQGDGRAQLDGVKLSNIDTSTVRLLPYTLGAVKHIYTADARNGNTQTRSLDLSPREVPGTLTVSGMNQIGLGTIFLIGGSGATSYSYTCVGKNGNAALTGTAFSTGSGAATLTTSTFNYVLCPTLQGATSVDVYRTVGGSTQGKILNVTNNAPGVFDTGLAGDGSSPPASDNYGTVDLTGAILKGPVTAPTGACSTNGAFVISQDGHGTWCSAGTWTAAF